MKVLVPIKRVPDYQAKIKVKADGSGIETDGIKWIINPFDEIAIEEAVRLKEKGIATETIVVCIGVDDAQQQLRYALALGIDRAILVKAPLTDSYMAAKILEILVKKEAPDLIIAGKQGIDSDANQTAQLLATYLGWPQACFISKLDIAADKKSALTIREVDGGLETLEVLLPAVISTDLRLNEPRFATLPGQMKAKKKLLTEMTLFELGLDSLKPKVTIRKMMTPTKRQAGRKVNSVPELVKALKEEAKVL